MEELLGDGPQSRVGSPRCGQAGGRGRRARAPTAFPACGYGQTGLPPEAILVCQFASTMSATFFGIGT